MTLTASDPEGQPLQVTWTASRGALDATTGTAVTWRATGPGSGPATITAVASDGVTSATASVTVMVVGAGATPPTPTMPPGGDDAAAFLPESTPPRFDGRREVLDDLGVELTHPEDWRVERPEPGEWLGISPTGAIGLGIKAVDRYPGSLEALQDERSWDLAGTNAEIGSFDRSEAFVGGMIAEAWTTTFRVGGARLKKADLFLERGSRTYRIMIFADADTVSEELESQLLRSMTFLEAPTAEDRLLSMLERHTPINPVVFTTVEDGADADSPADHVVLFGDRVLKVSPTASLEGLMTWTTPRMPMAYRAEWGGAVLLGGPDARLPAGTSGSAELVLAQAVSLQGVPSPRLRFFTRSLGPDGTPVEAEVVWHRADPDRDPRLPDGGTRLAAFSLAGQAGWVVHDVDLGVMWGERGRLGIRLIRRVPTFDSMAGVLIDDLEIYNAAGF